MAELTLKGTISEVLPVQSGNSKNGEWKKQTFVISETYQKNDGTEGENLVAFELFGEDKINKFAQYNKVGDKVDIKGSVRSNRWFTINLLTLVNLFSPVCLGLVLSHIRLGTPL